MRLISTAGALVLLAPTLALGQVITSSYIWRGYGGDSYHNADSTVAASPYTKVKWSVSLDDARSYYGNEVLIHYASPAITAKNTLIHGFRYTTTVNGSSDYDNWKVFGRAGATGAQLWELDTDYSAPLVWPSDWTSVYPLAISGVSTVFAAGGGGTLLVKANADIATSAVTRVSFYSALANYSANPSLYSNIKICTPLITDSLGDVYYGYVVNGTVPPALTHVLGTGGIVRYSPQLGSTFKSIQSLNIDSSVSRPAVNASPVVSRDGKSVYFSICDSGNYDAYLVKADSKLLTVQASVKLLDPSTPGYPAGTITESSSSPMVGPDGHVFYGVFGYYWRESHGWMLQFDANLKPVVDSSGKPIVGSFGWDDTPSVVASNWVPSYKGTSSYLILTKYNNYAVGDGDGLNKVAVLDPSSDSITRDRQTGIPVMNEILTVLGPSPDPGARAEGYSQAVREWCINSAAIDSVNKGAVVNSEDGNCYFWSFVTNTLTQVKTLAPPTGEAYTSTVIGPDGTIYAINNSVLWAVGK